MASHWPVWKRFEPTPPPPGIRETAPVVVIGAGPVGLTLALDLVRKGHRVVVLARHPFIAGGSKAICFSKRSLDIFDRLGIGEQVVAKGVAWNVGKVFAGDNAEPLYEFDMLPVSGQKNPGFVNIQQYYVEDYLIDALSDNPLADIRWGHEAIGIEQGDAMATVTIATGDVDYRIEAGWVIACDGSRSPMRERLGLEFEGRVFEDNFLIADVKFRESFPAERWFWFDPPFNPGRSALLHKQPDDVWRLDFQLGWDIDREAAVRPENVEPYVRAMLGEDVAFTAEWYSVYTFQCRRLQRFVHGRVIFAGDSAHLVSPFGARGCNGGIADADNLGWKLDLVLKGICGPDLVASYDAEAIVAADENIRQSTRSTNFLAPKGRANTALRDAVLELAAKYRFARPLVNSGRLATAVSYPKSPLHTPDIDEWNGGVPPGSPAVDAPLGEDWLLQRLGDDFAILRHGGNAQAPNVRVIDLVDFAETQWVVERYALLHGAAVLFRPDQYVAARWRNDPQPDLVSQALSRAKGA